MNIKGKIDNVAVFVIIAVVAVAVFYFFQGGDIIPTKEGDIVNGYFDEASQQCWPNKNSPVGSTFPAGQIASTFYQCCLNQAGQQIDCNNPSKILGTFAIYQGVAGIFSVTHGVQITNTGNVDLTNGWVDSAAWSPIHTELTSAYSGMIGSTSLQAGAIAQGTARAFSSGGIDLQLIGGEPGFPITYTLSLVTKGSAVGLPDASQTTPASMTVEKEGIGFSVAINLG